MLQNKRWFQILTFLIMFFLLVWLISVTDFIFKPAFQYVGAVAFPFIAAGILYYLTRPIMHLLERVKVKRTIAIIIVFLLLLFVGFIIIMYIAPIAQKQFMNLINNIPKMVLWAQELITYWQANQTAIPQEINDAITHVTDNLQTYIENVLNYIFGFIGSLINFITSLVLVPFFLFFMLKDGEKFLPFITRIFEKKKANNIRSLLSKIDHTLASFIQGQLIVSFILGVLLFVGYLAIGLNYSLTLGLFAMVMNVVPFIGPFIAVVPALIVGAFQDPMMIIWVCIITLIAQQVESNLISPNVMGRALHMHPLTIITVILAAGAIAGFIGILFAVPFYSVIKTIIVHFYETYRKSKKNEEDALI